MTNDWFSKLSTQLHWESDKLRSYELPLPQWMEPVPDGYKNAPDDESRRRLIVNRRDKQQKLLESMSKI